MSVLVFSGTHRRYKYITNAVIDAFDDVTVIAQTIRKGDYVGKYDDPLINGHLMRRDVVESEYYPETEFHSCDGIAEVSELNADISTLISDINPSVIFIFGTGMITGELFERVIQYPSINLHLGLAPYYKGSDTLLWPLYLQQPYRIGITLHQIDRYADNGPIYYRQVTDFGIADSIHDIFCKTIHQAVEPTLDVLEMLLSEESTITPYTQQPEGKTFRKGEFTPQHLKVIYQLIESGMLRRYVSLLRKDKSRDRLAAIISKRIVNCTDSIVGEITNEFHNWLEEEAL